LREQLRREQDAHAEARRIIAGLVQRVPELEAAREADQSAEEGVPTPTPTEEREAPEEPSSRSWWRRFFGY
jgi:hypothetical protein